MVVSLNVDEFAYEHFTVKKGSDVICQELVEMLGHNCKKETWEGVGEGSQTPNDPWARSNS